MFSENNMPLQSLIQVPSTSCVIKSFQRELKRDDGSIVASITNFSDVRLEKNTNCS